MWIRCQDLFPGLLKFTSFYYIAILILISYFQIYGFIKSSSTDLQSTLYFGCRPTVLYPSMSSKSTDPPGELTRIQHWQQYSNWLRTKGGHWDQSLNVPKVQDAFLRASHTTMSICVVKEQSVHR